MLDYVPKLRHVGNKTVSKIAFGHVSKTLFFLGKTLLFRSNVSMLETYTDQKHSTNGVQDGMHLCIDLLTILLNVWCRVGKQSQPRIDFGTKIQHNPSKNRLQEASRK